MSDPKPVIECNKRHYPEPEELQKNCRLSQDISSRSEVNGNTQNNKKKMKYQQRKGAGISSDGSSGTRHAGRQVLGKTEELGEFVYKIGCNDQADAFIRTTEAIAEYVGVNYGWKMRMLVKNRRETVFTKPTMPTAAKVTTRSQAGTETKVPGSVSSAQMADYKAELDNYHRDTREYQDNKAKVFVVILGQCTVAVLSWLENGQGLTDLEVDLDVIGLLGKLETMAFSTGGVQEPFVSLAYSLRRLTMMQQGTKEGVAKYYKRFKISADVLGGHWGDFHPPKLVKNGVTEEQAQDRLLARIFLMGADKGRFGSLLEEYNNSYVAGIDNYPKSLEATLTLLSNYQDSKSGLGKGLDGRDYGLGANFAQKGKKDLSKIQCHSCKEYGHYANNCPNQKKSLAQADSDNTTEGKETTQMETQVRRRRSNSRTRVGWTG
jgi:hypothetical protein